MKALQVLVTAGALALLLGGGPSHAADAATEGMPNGSGTHADLVALLQEFLESEDPARARRGN